MHEMTFVGGGAHPNDERWAVARVNHVGKPRGCTAVRRGRGGKEKKWTDCVQSDIRAFGIAGSWEATALEAEIDR